MFLRTVKGTNADYLYLVEGYRENGKVKQRNLLSFGKIADLDPEQVADIAMKLLDLCPKNSLVDLSCTEEIARKNWGIPLVIENLWNKFNLNSFFATTFKQRKLKYNISDAIKLMLASRLNQPCSKYRAYSNREYYNNLSNIELHNIYKSLTELSTLKDELEQHLFTQCKKQFDLTLDVVFFDVTTFYFESTNADELRNFGYGKDGKFNEVQVVLSLLVNKEGLPIGFDLYPGNTYEGNTLNDAIIKLKNKYNISKVIIVADRGLNSGMNLSKIKDKSFEYIIGCRFKNTSKSMQNKILAIDKYEQIATGDDDILKYTVIDNKKSIKSESNKVINSIDDRIICTWSSKRARKDSKDRERLVNKAQGIINSNKTTDKRGAKKYITLEVNKPMKMNENKIIEDAKWDGFYAIETSDKSLSPQKVLEAYHSLWKIEESFRIYKSHLETRPLYHWTPERIKGHFVLSYIAFLFERTLEVELKIRGKNISTPTKIRDSLNSMEFSELLCGKNKHKLYAKVDSLGADILKLLSISIPPKALAN